MHAPCDEESPLCHAHANRKTLFPQRGEARPQEELPKLWSERVRLIDDSPPERFHAPAELLPPAVGVDVEVQVREPLTDVSGAR